MDTLPSTSTEDPTCLCFFGIQLYERHTTTIGPSLSIGQTEEPRVLASTKKTKQPKSLNISPERESPLTPTHNQSVTHRFCNNSDGPGRGLPNDKSVYRRTTRVPSFSKQRRTVLWNRSVSYTVLIYQKTDKGRISRQIALDNWTDGLIDGECSG